LIAIYTHDAGACTLFYYTAVSLCVVFVYHSITTTVLPMSNFTFTYVFQISNIYTPRECTSWKISTSAFYFDIYVLPCYIRYNYYLREVLMNVPLRWLMKISQTFVRHFTWGNRYVLLVYAEHLHLFPCEYS